MAAPELRMGRNPGSLPPYFPAVQQELSILWVWWLKALAVPFSRWEAITCKSQEPQAQVLGPQQKPQPHSTHQRMALARWLLLRERGGWQAKLPTHSRSRT